MSANDNQWFCTLCNKTFEMESDLAESERRCPFCMRRTGLTKGGTQPDGKTGEASAFPSHTVKRKGSWWKWLLVAVSVGAAGAGGWWAWSIWSVPGPMDDLERVALSEDLKLLLDVEPQDSRLATCDSLEGYRRLLEETGLLGDAAQTGVETSQEAPAALRSVGTLLGGGDRALPAEALAIGLACLRSHGMFAQPCRPAKVDLTAPMPRQSVGLCSVKDGKVESAVLIPDGGEVTPEELEVFTPAQGGAWVLATLGAMAQEPGEAYRLFGAALQAWEDPLVRFQLGEAKLRFKVPDFASEDMAKALSAGYNEQGAVRLAEVQAGLGHWDEALGLYQRVLQGSPSSPVAKLGKVKALLSMGQMKEAETLLAELEREAPSLEGLNHVLAAWHLANKRTDQALAALKKELDTRPTVSSALAWIRTLESVKGTAEAAKALAELKVPGVELELEALRLQLTQGQKAESAQSAEKLAQKYPTDPNVMRACGLAFFDAGELGKAEAAFAAADQYGQNKEFESLTYLTLVRYLMESKGLKSAQSGEATLKMLESRHPNADVDVALSLNGLGLWKQAREILEKKLESDPLRKVDIAVNLYGLYLRNGDPAKADALRKRILGELPEAERTGVEAGFQHELESVKEPEDTPSSASTPTPVPKSRSIDPKAEMK